MTDIAKGQVLYDATDALLLAKEAQIALTNAEIIVDSDTLLAIAANDLKAVKALQHRVEEKRTAITKPLNQAAKAINDLFRAPKDYLDLAEKSLKAAILTYTAAQEKIAAEALRKAEEVTRAERAILAAEHSVQERIASEAQYAAQQAQVEAEAAAAAGDTRAAAAAQGMVQEHAALAETAQALADAAAQTADVITTQVARSSPQKIFGISGRVTYTVHVDDLRALIKAVADGVAPLQCLCADEKFLGAQARAFKQAGPLYPGVATIAERSLAARAG